MRILRKHFVTHEDCADGAVRRLRDCFPAAFYLPQMRQSEALPLEGKVGCVATRMRWKWKILISSPMKHVLSLSQGSHYGKGSCQR